MTFVLRGENDDTDLVQRPTKRRRVVADCIRKRSMRQCRRCHRPECPGNCDILKCPYRCMVPCKSCHRTTGCRGVDGGKKCTWGGGQ